jgi:hypothetical protein
VCRWCLRAQFLVIHVLTCTFLNMSNISVQFHHVCRCHRANSSMCVGVTGQIPACVSTLNPKCDRLHVSLNSVLRSMPGIEPPGKMNHTNESYTKFHSQFNRDTKITYYVYQILHKMWQGGSVQNVRTVQCTVLYRIRTVRCILDVKKP